MKEGLKYRTVFSNILILIQIKNSATYFEMYSISISNYKNTIYIHKIY